MEKVDEKKKIHFCYRQMEKVEQAWSWSCVSSSEISGSDLIGTYKQTKANSNAEAYTKAKSNTHPQTSIKPWELPIIHFKIFCCKERRVIVNVGIIFFAISVIWNLQNLRLWR